MKTPANDNDHITSTAASPAVWLAEGQSSQRDMLASLQTLKNHADTPFNIIASHRHNRPEIFEFADSVYREPSTSTAENDEQVVLESVEPLMPRWQFVLEQAQKNNVKVLLTGRNGIDYEAHREAFDAAGIRLLTGATSGAALEVIDDKFAFMQQCHQHDIPVAEAWRFDNVAELEALLDMHGDQPLCVKPVTGIFAQGFWRLDLAKNDGELYDSFEHLYFTEEKKINTTQFINAYANSLMVHERPIPMLLMPYLSGQEYSIDVVCEYGEVLAAVTRYKTGKIQHIGYEQAVMDVVIPLIKAFGCDGIVSVQTKADDDGQHRVLEINSRPSGGIDYTTHSGVDLTQVGFAYWLGLTDKPILADIAQQITPCQVRSIMVGVKVEEDITE
ncbi:MULTISPECIES: ATP-grasp domain-containing protein [Psychrobacter]|uniref:ATP-grasp domain-containing protein n=1 Tax=Psychrobacter immobilis TaxID=498 RepID=A0A2V2A5U7_PSYIM|nr:MULTISPECIES: ATP-grasp domain-containing protein [Psychrobacter]MCG3871588.1 ATP-grasp domain-containing protein [Psychrobacter sp. Ps7]PWK15081.1 ATP-grasp domain-containing protein [Psychrobacter immobilis]